MSKLAIIKIHPGLNMALPQLSGDLTRAGHKTRMVFFKDYSVKDYFESTFTTEHQLAPDVVYTEFGLEYELLERALRKFQPHAIGLSVISLSIPEAIKTTQFLRSKFSVPIIWGGVGTTLQPEIAIDHADMVCIGEGEEVIVEFADCIKNKTDWTTIEGTWAKKPDGTIIKNARRPSGNLDDIAIPDWNISKMEYIHKKRVLRGQEAYHLMAQGDYQIMTQRGCPFSCSFCVESRYQEMFGKKNSLRRRSVDLVMEELHAAKEKFNPLVIYFWDDVFTVNPRWLKEFLPRYRDEIGIPFWCYTYPTTHDLDLLKDLKEAGCNSITMGIQSGSERILQDVYNRPTPLKRVIEASGEIIAAGMKGYFDLISKSEFETEEDLKSTFRFLIDLPQEMNYMGFAEMNSYPTYSYTRKAEAAREENLVTSISAVDEKTYEYYHRLYWVARNPFLEKKEKLEIGEQTIFREQPELLNQYIYGERTIERAIFELRQALIHDEHPNKLFPPPEYVHVPVSFANVAK